MAISYEEKKNVCGSCSKFAMCLIKDDTDYQGCGEYENATAEQLRKEIEQSKDFMKGLSEGRKQEREEILKEVEKVIDGFIIDIRKLKDGSGDEIDGRLEGEIILLQQIQIELKSIIQARGENKMKGIGGER